MPVAKPIKSFKVELWAQCVFACGDEAKKCDHLNE